MDQMEENAESRLSERRQGGQPTYRFGGRGANGSKWFVVGEFSEKKKEVDRGPLFFLPRNSKPMPHRMLVMGRLATQRKRVTCDSVAV